MGTQRRRKVNLLLQPALQLKLPLFMVLVTVAFLMFQLAHGHFAYSKLYSTVIKESGSSPVLADLLHGQTRDFIEVSAELGVLYILVVIAICVTYAHRMIGPTVAFRRHVEALKNGDYRSRIKLRRRDAFSELAGDLNELAEILERDEKPRG